MRFNLFIVGFLVLLLSVSFVAAQEGHIKLLAVGGGENKSGSVLDLSLQIEPGRGRVFVETIPLTKIATQVSMRFAQAMACSELEIDCDQLDFYFTIRGYPGVVGGPSAGAAATVLTMALLDNVQFDQDVVVTGTINSGGIVGVVGGVKEKIEAAASQELKTVLIPKGTALHVTDDNVSLNLVEHGKSLGIEVVEVVSIRDALPYFGEFALPQVGVDFVVSEDFEQKMYAVAKTLCDRRDSLSLLVDDADQVLGNLTTYATQSIEEQNYYAAASYCFRANVRLNQAYFELRNLTDEALDLERAAVLEQISQFEAEVELRPLSTLTDLQVYMSVDERLQEARLLAQEMDSSADLAYAIERLESAKSWASFFEGSDREFVVDEARLEKACTDKLGEAEERYSYISEFVSQPLATMRDTLDGSYEGLASQNFVRCLYGASKAKAEIDSLLAFVPEDDMLDLVQAKIDAANRNIRRSQAKGVFPIISYNYVRYAQSLKEVDLRTALLFAEYSLEFSALDIYFDEVGARVDADSIFAMTPLASFFIGIGVGMLFTLVYLSFAVGYVKRGMKNSVSEKKTRQTPKRSRGKKR